ncbi:AAA family ATPase [Acinetobacter bereziniae]|uniref:ATP-dependent nuclease n=1 Tax=Acinetobacter seifertii TaxID=1530123 RepID=UPI003BE9C21D|nr:AAA family ATPase [Acinetobacter bereziniae]
MQSASTELTSKFRDWWKQGEYRFRFEADGNHFRIWVSDDKRPEDIELEGRSTGLQWFLSFYLTFLVESKDAHKNSILLLDEPGLSLHPLAQKDLSLFFGNLSKTNQILYTTHSPFLVDSNHLNQVKAVYIQDDGTTNISSNLRANEGNSSQTKSIYPVHAALGLSVSEMLFNNCTPVLVEGPSDQIYLSAIKTLLISFGELTPKKDIIFIPSGGTRGVKPIVSLLTGKNDELPIVLLDGDTQGSKMAEALRKDLYQDTPNSILIVSEIIGMDQAEIEDLIPPSIMKKLSRYQLRSNDPDCDFEDYYAKDLPILKQLEEFAVTNEIMLEKGWKVEFAKLVKNHLLKISRDKISEDTINVWKTLFSKLN